VQGEARGFQKRETEPLVARFQAHRVERRWGTVGRVVGSCRSGGGGVWQHEARRGGLGVWVKNLKPSHHGPVSGCFWVERSLLVTETPPAVI